MIRTLLIPIAALVLAAAPAHAQQDAKREHKAGDAATRAARQTEHMRSSLSLTPEQATRVEAINLQHQQDSEAARKALKEERDRKRQELRSAYDAELKAVLTREQYTRLLEQRQKQQDKRAQKGVKERPAKARPEHQE